MGQIYLSYEEHPNLQQLVGGIPWGSNIVLFTKCAKCKDVEQSASAFGRGKWTMVNGKSIKRRAKLKTRASVNRLRRFSRLKREQICNLFNCTVQLV